MTFDLTRLPRTVSLIRAGECDEGKTGAAAASAAAAFVLAGDVAAASPLLLILDQSTLPFAETYLCTADWQEVVEWITRLQVRGAPAIGIAGAAACVLASSALSCSENGEDCIGQLDEAFSAISHARPTAVNLSWAVRRMRSRAMSLLKAGCTFRQVTDALFDDVIEMERADEAANRAMGRWGAALLPSHATILTHCNAGSLATSFFGTALGVVYAAAEEGKIERVFADETRPVCQGSRLTVWELARAGIPVTLICDDMAASVMAEGSIDAVIVGADRIAANGDVANKIGTLGVAILADHFDIPFYVAAPTSTIDPHTPCGAQIAIEQRPVEEVMPSSMMGVEVLNPAFDVTPSRLIRAIITEKGVFKPQDVMDALSTQ